MRTISSAANRVEHGLTAGFVQALPAVGVEAVTAGGAGATVGAGAVLPAAGAAAGGYIIGTGINHLPRIWGGRKISDVLGDAIGDLLFGDELEELAKVIFGPNGTFPGSPLPGGSPDPVVFPKTDDPGRLPNGKCAPCPPNSPAWEVLDPGHGGTTSHWHWIEWHQNPTTCVCYSVRRSSPTKPPGA